MSILDDAIREHLELKRAHGADDAEVKSLEDEAFGPPQRPDEIDPFAEAPTEFLHVPGGDRGRACRRSATKQERSGRRPDIADLQEAPPADAALFDAEAAPDAGPVEDEHSPAPDAPPPSPTDAAAVPLPPPPGEAPARRPGAARRTDEAPAPPTDEELAPPAPPAEEEHPAGEHEAIVDAGPSTEERHAIADQPTQMFDVQAHVEAEAAAAPATGEQASPTDEELVDAVQEEPQAAPPAPEDSRAADRALRAAAARQPRPRRRGRRPPARRGRAGGGLRRIRLLQRTAALRGARPGARGAAAADRRAPRDAAVRRRARGRRPGRHLRLRVPAGGVPAGEALRGRPLPGSAAPGRRGGSGRGARRGRGQDTDFDPDTGHEDVLEDTPRFLEDAPEDDDLWFEQKPPKDFDLDYRLETRAGKPRSRPRVWSSPTAMCGRSTAST